MFSLFFNNFTNLFFAVLGLHCALAFLSCSEQGLYILYIKYINVAGWLETGILSLLFWSVQITQCLFSFGCAGPFFAARGLSLGAASRNYTNCCAGFSLLQLLLLQSTSFGAQAQYLCCLSLVAPRHMVSSQTRDQTCVPCTGRWILYHWTTREVSLSGFQLSKSQYLSTRILLCLLTVNTLPNKIWGHHPITGRSENQERLP